ncbi:MAG: sugar transferase [Dehalococcoidia bacterium]|nr:sugar transferase [Dehalococcoidia bacterium]
MATRGRSLRSPGVKPDRRAQSAALDAEQTLSLSAWAGSLEWLETGSGLNQRLYIAAKRALDLAIAMCAILAALPVMIVIALLIRLDSPGPVLFRQSRLGKDARPFTMLKFRTMYVDSGDIPTHLIERNESTGPLFKMRHDPRITRAGRWLRRTSLDELPQLFNILFGQMTLVGPRPPLPRELAGYEQVQRARLRVVPGLTGLWQVNGRSNLPFEEMVRLDLRYIEERSLWMDVKIILKTVPCVLFGRGAY